MEVVRGLVSPTPFMESCATLVLQFTNCMPGWHIPNNCMVCLTCLWCHWKASVIPGKEETLKLTYVKQHNQCSSPHDLGISEYFLASQSSKTQKLKLWQNSKTRIVTKLKNSNFDNVKNVTKLKLWQNSKCERKKKLKNSKCDKIQIMTKLKNSKCDNNQKFNLWHNSKTQIVTKLEKVL